MLLFVLSFNVTAPLWLPDANDSRMEQRLLGEEESNEADDDCEEENPKEQYRATHSTSALVFQTVPPLQKDDDFAEIVNFQPLHHPGVPELPPKA